MSIFSTETEVVDLLAAAQLQDLPKGVKQVADICADRGGPGSKTPKDADAGQRAYSLKKKASLPITVSQLFEGQYNQHHIIYFLKFEISRWEFPPRLFTADGGEAAERLQNSAPDNLQRRWRRADLCHSRQTSGIVLP